ncbi:hypothetical protein RSD66_08775 [Brevundimonas sp. S1H14]|uniref:hypothetical protein n=1 Tax=Brevundimonas sp. S1H14 TaxID=3078084 RepID=UPI0039EC94DD
MASYMSLDSPLPESRSMKSYGLSQRPCDHSLENPAEAVPQALKVENNRFDESVSVFILFPTPAAVNLTLKDAGLYCFPVSTAGRAPFPRALR